MSVAIGICKVSCLIIADYDSLLSIKRHSPLPGSYKYFIPNHLFTFALSIL